MIVCITSGGDWHDASVDNVVLLTDDYSMRELGNMYAALYEASRDAKGYAQLSRFPDWLIEQKYARQPLPNELEEYSY